MFEFDPTIDGRTPEHVRWTIAHECPLRAGTDVNDPDQTERLLRGLPPIMNARDTNTIVGSLVLNEYSRNRIFAFDAERVAAPLGGFSEIDRCCHQCVANLPLLGEGGRSRSWASCFGMVRLPIDPNERENLFASLDNPFSMIVSEDHPRSTTKHRWYRIVAGLADDSIDRAPIVKELGSAVMDVAMEFPFQFPQERVDWISMAMAISAVDNNSDLMISFSFHPAGLTTGRTWQVDPHCIRCKASWWDKKRTTCEMCGHEGGRQESRTRKRIGTRPFRPIEEFVPAEQVPAIIEQWRAKLNASNSPSQPVSLLGRIVGGLGRWFGRGGS
jgi:hypothetical protein